MGLGEVADLVGCRVEDLHVVLGQGSLDLVGGAAQVREGDGRRFLTGWSLGMAFSGVLGLDLPSGVAIPQ